MEKIIFFFIFSNLIISSLSIVSIWNFTNSAIDLIEINNPFKYDIVNTVIHDNLRHILTKTIERLTTGEITIERRVRCEYNGNSNAVNSIVYFEDIESAYTDKYQKYYICPKGNYHVFYQDTSGYIRNLTSDEFTDDKSDWELQCYYQFLKGKIFIFYLNKYEYIYQINVDSGQIMAIPNSKFKILSYRWTTTDTSGRYPMYAIIEKDNEIKIMEITITLGSPSSISIGSSNNLFKIYESNYKILLNDNNSNSKLYYFSYNSTSMKIKTGYSPNLGTISSINSFTVNINETSPLEFIENMNIIYIKFIPYTKYVYYKLQKINTQIYYYGVIDIELNKVIFNTEEEIKTFIPYNKFSMLAVTSNSAYQICAIYSSKCSETCNLDIQYDINKKNECTSRTCSSYTLLLDNICVYDCDLNYFEKKDLKCGLCRDLTPSTPYKIVNQTGCLASKPNNSIEINEDLKLISCVEGFSFINRSCIRTDCYKSCETCSIKSYNESQQSCLTCRSDYPILFNNNCLQKCPKKYYLSENTCRECPIGCTDCINEKKCSSCSDGYYLDETCKKCHSNCVSCHGEGDEDNNNCKECIPGLLLINTTCSNGCQKKQYKSGNTCYPCKKVCASCDNGSECKTCVDNYYLNNSICLQCSPGCKTCTTKGDEKNQNCTSCLDNLYLVNGGEFENNCVENCPENTFLNVTLKICNYVKPNNAESAINKDDSLSSLLIWVFVAVAGFLFLLINIIFFCRICCCKEKDDDDTVETIQTELKENFTIN